MILSSDKLQTAFTWGESIGFNDNLLRVNSHHFSICMPTETLQKEMRVFIHRKFYFRFNIIIYIFLMVYLSIYFFLNPLMVLFTELEVRFLWQISYKIWQWILFDYDISSIDIPSCIYNLWIINFEFLTKVLLSEWNCRYLVPIENFINLFDKL